jgi:mono/diheme cytochrome c family protein
MTASKSKWLLGLGALVGLGASTAAFGLPWDVDMADSQAVKGYEGQLVGIPDGAVAQDSVLSPRSYAPNFVRGSAEGEALQPPMPASEQVLATGETMYKTYCAPCHGNDGVNLGPVAQPGRYPGVVALAGNTGIAKNRSDGWIYLTIRNGGAIMPYYGWAMTDDEIWATVHYIRTMPNAKYIPPAPKAEEGEQ